jgi:hypothetical protein
MTAEHLSDEQLATAVGVELLGAGVLTEDAVALLRRHLAAARYAERAAIVGFLRRRADVLALGRPRDRADAAVLDVMARSIERGEHRS